MQEDADEGGSCGALESMSLMVVTDGSCAIQSASLHRLTKPLRSAVKREWSASGSASKGLATSRNFGRAYVPATGLGGRSEMLISSGSSVTGSEIDRSRDDASEMVSS